MNSQQIELVQSTVPVLRENGVALTSYFYKRMLNNHPELKKCLQSGPSKYRTPATRTSCCGTSLCRAH